MGRHGLHASMVMASLMLLVEPASAEWTEQAANSPHWLNVVHAVTHEIAWAGGGAGQVVRTTDGGSSWDSRPVPGADVFGGLFAFDGEACVAADAYGRFWRTTDGGLSWDQVHDAGTFINGIHFFDAENGWAVGDPDGGRFVILGTTDGGVTWTRSATEPPATGYGLSRSFSWIGTEIGVFGTSQYLVWRTSDGGASWDSVRTSVEQVAGLALNDDGSGLAGGSRLAMDRTTDFGATWYPIAFPYTDFIFAIEWIQGTPEAWAQSHGPNVFQTKDGGSSWTEHVLAPDYIGEDVDFVDQTTGWSVGSRNHTTGRVFKYTTVTGVSDPGLAPAKLVVSSHPNPFQASTTFRLELTGNRPVEIAIYDLAGRRVTSLAETEPGLHEIRWDGRDHTGRPVPDGVYLYRVAGPEGEITGRAVRTR